MIPSTHFTRALSKDPGSFLPAHILLEPQGHQKPLTMSYSLKIQSVANGIFVHDRVGCTFHKTGPSPLYLHREGVSHRFQKAPCLVLPLVALRPWSILLFCHTVTALPGVVLYSLLVFILDQESFMGHFSKGPDSSPGRAWVFKATLDNWEYSWCIKESAARETWVQSVS